MAWDISLLVATAAKGELDHVITDRRELPVDVLVGIPT